MSCSPFDLRDYFLGELAEPERRQMDVHLRGCEGCQEEMERLRITQSTLLTLRDEEVPQRIGFVSDPVFELSGARRLWQAFWGSAPKLGFASAAMLSVALLFFTFFRPAVPAPVTTATTVDTAKIERQVSERLAVEVHKAVAESEFQQEKKTDELLAAAERRYQEQRESDRQLVADRIAVLQKQFHVREDLMARFEPGDVR